MSNPFADFWCQKYKEGAVSIGKLAQYLELSLEETKAELKARSIPLGLGVKSKKDLMRDIENA